MDVKGFYYDELHFNYPSRKQIGDCLRKEDISVIFALSPKTPMEIGGFFYKLVCAVLINCYKTENDLPEKMYTKLIKEHLGNRGSVVKLRDGYTNLGQIIETKYNEITSVLQVFATGGSDILKFKFYSACDTNVMRNTDTCKRPADGKLTYILEAELLNCPPSGDQEIREVYFPLKGTNEKKKFRFILNCS